ncbi:MAG: protein-export chaperone SecB [Alphaproteobacteria bacterium]|nr:protein-export chaperone SecB [Alphaproteobacteria bacterium]
MKQEQKKAQKQAAATESKSPSLAIRSQYIKDLSFEIPTAPTLFQNISSQPHLTVDVNVVAEKLGDLTHDVALTLALNSDVDGQKLFILELTYAAILDLEAPEEHVDSILNIDIPTLLFPFARNIIAQCLMEGGLPPVMLNPIDFSAVYAARLAAKGKN